jgi:AcrR family transcriptional regulator
MRAPERREAVLQAAVVEFAQGGYTGTSTAAIARRVGVSQPYLFSLFPNKHEIFLQCITRSFRITEDALRMAAEGLSGQGAIAAMGARYRSLMSDTTLVQFQLQIYSVAANDPESRELGRRGMASLWRMIGEVTGEGPGAVLSFMSLGMLLNVLVSLDLPIEAPREQLSVDLADWAAEEAPATAELSS